MTLTPKWKKMFEIGKSKERQKKVCDVADLIRRFKRDLQAKLVEPKNIQKGHWSTVSIQYLYDRFRQEAEEELEPAYNAYLSSCYQGTTEDLIGEILDCVAFLVFMWDHLQPSLSAEERYDES